MIDSHGKVANSYTYDAFGQTIEAKEKVHNIFRYAGEQYDAGEAAVIGIYDMVKDPGKIVEGVGNAIAHPILTGEAICNAVSTSFKENVINGDANSRARFTGRVLGEIALSLVGTKGLDKVSNKVADAAKLANYIDEVADTAKVANYVDEVGDVAKVIEEVRTTGAYSSKINSGGNGLGKLAGKELNVSQKGLDIVKNHIGQFDAVPENIEMIKRLETALKNGEKISGADASFYMHEVAESTMMKELTKKMSFEEAYDIAHPSALQKYEVSPFSVYHPEVIGKYSECFGPAWKKFWGLE